MALVAWRLAAGTLSMREAGETTTILGWPVWYTYALMVPGVALTAIAGFYGAWVHWRTATRGGMSRMSPLLVGATLFAAMLVLMALRVPIAIAMFVPGAIGYIALSSEAALLSNLKGAMYARFSVYDLSVIPLFLLMGQFATQGGLSAALFRAAAAFVGHFRGGLAMAAVLACAAFGAICGSSVATAATVAQVALPEMKRFNYSGRLATATLAAGGTLGILIPPSVVLVVYAILARAEHREAVRGRDDSRHHRSARLPDRDRRLCPAASGPGARAAAALVAGAADDAVRGVADRGDLPDRVRRHLRRHLHADRGRGGRCRRDVHRRAC